jgi:hypothetical protein
MFESIAGKFQFKFKDRVSAANTQSVAKCISLSVTLPKQYVVYLGLRKDGFVKMSKQNGKIIVEIAT